MQSCDFDLILSNSKKQEGNLFFSQVNRGRYQQPKLWRHGYDTLRKTEFRLNWLISAFAQLSLALFERRAYLELSPLFRVETRQRIPQFYKSKDKPCFRAFRCFRHEEPIKSDSKRVYTQGVSVAYPLLN